MNHRYFLLLFLIPYALISQPTQTPPGIDTMVTSFLGREKMVITYSSGQVAKVIRTRRGKLHGKQEEYYTNGHPNTIKRFRGGLQHGFAEQYYLQGKLNSKIRFKKGFRSGPSMEYYPSGQLRSLTHYAVFEAPSISSTSTKRQEPLPDEQKSKLHGKAKYFNQEGVLESEGIFVDGKKHGVWKRYQQGVPAEFISYKDGRRHGYGIWFDQQGSVIRYNTFYEWIVQGNDTLKNVQDNEFVEFYSNGNLKKKYQYSMGKKHGDFLDYYENGQLRTHQIFHQHHPSGVWRSYDQEGRITFERHHDFREVNGEQRWVQHGPERSWVQDVLIMETMFVDGLQQGVRRDFHKDGSLKQTVEMVDGLVDGTVEEFYSNGTLKSSKVLRPIVSGSQIRGVNIGWNLSFDEVGTPLRAIYHDSIGEVLVIKSFFRGQMASYNAQKLMEISYFPNGAVQSISLQNYISHFSTSLHYYMDGQLRKLSFQNPETHVINHVEFTYDGRVAALYSSGYHNPDSLKPTKEQALKYAEAFGSRLIPNAFFSDPIKHGAYTLYHANGSVFASMNFEDDLPHGDFVFYDPIAQDTLMFHRFNRGVPTGDYVEKFAGKIPVIRRKINEKGREYLYEQYTGAGVPVRFRYVHDDGSQDDIEFYSNGQIKNFRNDLRKIHRHFSEAGMLLNEQVPLDTFLNRKVYRAYHLETGRLIRERFYTDDQQDSIQYQYYPDGTLHFTMPYENGERNGEYRSYNTSGELIQKGKYVQGKMDGPWVQYLNGSPDTTFYEDNKAIVRPTHVPCACQDTAISSNHLRFAQTVSSMVEYPVLKALLPGYITPVDSLNYTSIFFRELQAGGLGQRGGYANMRLLTFNDFRFNVPADEQIQLCLNPCATSGYVRSMKINIHQAGENLYRTFLYPKRVSLSLIKGPLKSADRNYPHFTAFYEIESLAVHEDEPMKLEIKNPASCFIPALIKDFLHVQITRADPIIFQELHYFPPNIPLQGLERNDFFGLNIREAQLSFSMLSDSTMHTITGTTDALLAGGYYCSGLMRIPVSKLDDNRFSIEFSDGSTKSFLLDDVGKLWRLAGFRRLSLNLYEEFLEITFFTE